MGSSYGYQQGVAAFNQAMKKVGLIINPLAGMGGKVGLKGTDGPEIAKKARLLGAIPEAGVKAVRALRELLPLSGQIEFLTCSGLMGEEALQQCGLSYRVIDPAVASQDKQRADLETDGARADLTLDGKQESLRNRSEPPHPAPLPRGGEGVTTNKTPDRNMEEGVTTAKTPDQNRVEGVAGAGRLDLRRADELAEAESLPNTGPQDTVVAARAMVASGIDLLLFAGGDGTARDIYNALGPDSAQAVIGIPAGVKIHSAVYAVNPRSAGQLARQFLQEGGLPLRRAEVMDIDEEAFRAGHLSASLYGYLSVPCAGGLMQHLKIGGAETEMSVLEAIAEQIAGDMDDETVYIIGPGSTTGPIMHKLGLENTLLGVDLVEKGKLLVADASEKDILSYIEGKKAKIIVTVIGGQGYIFGRGNQQISAAVIRQVGRENIIVIAVREKILALEQPRLLVDTGNDEVNSMLSGYIKIVTGYGEVLIYPVAT